ncbi:MAG: hypothetical protein GSR86_00170 [Desulfurococcales archaeon]|nr:hypothetical protein [Desulfurococcales archaeon]
MPGRGVHLEHAYRFARREGLSIDPRYIPLIEKLIDDPGLVRTSVLRAAEGCGDRIIARMVEALRAGLRYSTAMRHDWGLNRRRRGRSSELVKSLVRCLYGDDAPALVDLHSSLDVISMWGLGAGEYLEWARVNRVDPRVRAYILEEVYGGSG